MFLDQKSRFLELLAHFVGLMSFFSRKQNYIFIFHQPEDPHSSRIQVEELVNILAPVIFSWSFMHTNLNPTGVFFWWS